MSSSSQRILVSGACIIALGAACYGGFVYYQGKKVDDAIANINKILGTNEVTVSGEVTKKSFFTREIQLMLYLKDISERTKPLAVSNGVVNLGFSPKAVLHLTEIDQIDKNNIFLKSMRPTFAMDFNFRFTPKTASFSTEPFSASTKDAVLSFGKMAGKSTFLGTQEGFTSQNLSQLKTRFEIGTIAIRGQEEKKFREELILGSQSFESLSDRSSQTPLEFSYAINKVDFRSQKELGGAINLDNFTFSTSVAKQNSIFSQTFKTSLTDLTYKSILPLNIPKADIQLKLDWEKSASPYSALFYDTYGENLCKQNPTVCQENLPFLGNIGAAPQELSDAITTGKIGLEVLPSYIDAKDIKVSFSGNFRFTKDSNQVGKLSFKVSPAEGKSALPYLSFLPKYAYRMDGSDAISDILITFDSEFFYFSVNGQVFYRLPMV